MNKGKIKIFGDELWVITKS